MLINLRHGNIIGLLGACTYTKQWFLLTELMDNGTLLNALNENRVPLSQEQRHDIVLGMLMGLNNMHMRRVSHRDLKSANMLPVDVGNMANVRLLRVRISLLSSLPESLLQPHMLELLDCRCNGFAKLSHGMGRMMNLQAQLLGNNRLWFSPVDLRRLTRLSTLQICLNDSNSFPPQHLVGTLCFLGSDNVPTHERV